MERRERALNIGHELETNRGGHHVRHRASPQITIRHWTRSLRSHSLGNINAAAAAAAAPYSVAVVSVATTRLIAAADPPGS
jgi:hypothetical protein